LVLRSYTGLEDICFSYATSGRDAPLKGINNAVGAFLNAVVCRVRVPSTATVFQALGQVKSDFVESLSHQYFSATDEAQSGDFSRLKGNTLMSCQRKAATELQGSGLGFELIDAVNPNEVSCDTFILRSAQTYSVAVRHVDQHSDRLGRSRSHD
jgi:hypothetical protein